MEIELHVVCIVNLLLNFRRTKGGHRKYMLS